MHPELFRLPLVGIQIQTYGFCLMIGFLTAVWLAMGRAERLKASPDRVLDLSLVALIFGVGGARLFYVVHYWGVQFSQADNPIMAAIDCRAGGLEFLGGFLGAAIGIMVYLWIKRESLRLYLDILTPGLMWGLAIGRIGCYFNGCCFGKLCVAAGSLTAGAAQPALPWAVEFPYGSSVHRHQWEHRQVTVPAELVASQGIPPYLLPASTLSMPVERREGPTRALEAIKKKLDQARADAKSAGEDPTTSSKVKALKAEYEKQRHAAQEFMMKEHLHVLKLAQQYPSRYDPQRPTSVSDLQYMAATCHSLPVHPTQLYASGHAMVLSLFLSYLVYRRRRHGIVFGYMLVMYPIARFLLELIRTDNPHDSFGLTVSQATSVGLFVCGCIYLYVVYKLLPERSPRVAAIEADVARRKAAQAEAEAAKAEQADQS